MSSSLSPVRTAASASVIAWTAILESRRRSAISSAGLIWRGRGRRVRPPPEAEGGPDPPPRGECCLGPEHGCPGDGGNSALNIQNPSRCPCYAQLDELRG